jgi:hypothetical protein
MGKQKGAAFAAATRPSSTSGSGADFTRITGFRQATKDVYRDERD